MLVLKVTICLVILPDKFVFVPDVSDIIGVKEVHCTILRYEKRKLVIMNRVTFSPSLITSIFKLSKTGKFHKPNGEFHDG